MMHRLSLALLLPCLLAASPVRAADPVPAGAEVGSLPLQELRMFVDAFEKIRRAHVEPVDDSTLLRYAIQGMLNGLDPHSAFLDARDFRDLQDATSGEFGGLGMEVGMEDGFVRVVAPIDDTPAQRAGIESGDLLIRIDDKPVTGMTLDEAIGLMRGEPGTRIRLTLMREGIDQPIEMTLTRAVIQVRSVRQRSLEPGFGYIRIANFQEDTGDEFERAIEALQAANRPLKGLVIDLRNNPGGLLQSSVAVVDALLASGRIVYTEGRLPESRMSFEAAGVDITDGLPLVVLINGGSASASEIVAGALQDHRRAVILGTPSFGKGSVQSVIPLSEDEAIKLTTARYFTPSGRSIQAQGIEPDVLVERARLASAEPPQGLRVSEADLKGRLSNGQADPAASGRTVKKPEDSSANLQASDNQLFEALNLLKGVHILSRGQAR